MKSLLILGAGGFGHMIQETAMQLGYEKVSFLDDAVKDPLVVGNAVITGIFLTPMRRLWRLLEIMECVCTGRRS